MSHRRIPTSVQPPVLDLASVRVGDVVRADDAWGCLDRGDVLVRKGGDGTLYVRCRDGEHALDHLTDRAGRAIGFSGGLTR